MEGDLPKLLSRTAELLLAGGHTLAVAESCTGGALSQAITAAPGASRFFSGGVIAYSASVKRYVLHIDQKFLETYGTVSKETAAAMAAGVRKICGADFGVSVTGVAGPEELEGKPVGTIHIAAASEDRTEVLSLLLQGDREAIRKQACFEALAFLSRFLAS